MQPIAFLQNLSPWEIILICLVILLFFGAKRLPELSRSMGKSLKEFKKATSNIEDDFRTAMDEEDEVDKPIKASRSPATTAPKEVEPEDVLDDDLAKAAENDENKDSNKEKEASKA